MEQKNHFTIRDESGEAPLLEIIRRADVTDGDLVELLQLFIAATVEGEAQASGQALQSSGESSPEKAELKLMARTDQGEATPLALLIKTAGLDKPGNVVDLELVRLRTVNSAVRDAYRPAGSAPEEEKP